MVFSALTGKRSEVEMTHKEHVKKALEEAIPFVDSRGYGGVAHIMHDALELLKEQEAKTGHWIFESRYCDAWSNICSECGRLMTTGEGVYANYCSNCGAKMTGGEEK